MELYKEVGYLSLKQLIQIGFHQALNDVDVSHLVNGSGPDDVPNVDDVFMAESREDLDFPQSSLAIGLVFKRTDFLYSHLCIGIRIKRRPVKAYFMFTFLKVRFSRFSRFSNLVTFTNYRV